MKISILIPCHNEERSIAECLNSCLNQTRKLDQILVVNDGSTDRTQEILETFGDRITHVTIPVATGNKSHAQEYGIKFITGDVFISTDADTVLDSNFVKFVEEDFENEKVSAVAGYVRSRKYNWITACRAFEYAIGQNLHKLAQHYINFLFVIPGAAGGFRTKIFTEHIQFDHDTLTEDLDFTYRLHKKGLKILYDRRAVVFTQDPLSIKSYINQMRRWFGGGWQCLVKHWDLAMRSPKVALELSLMYFEGITFSLLLFVLPFLSLKFYLTIIISYFITATSFAIFAALKERRLELVLVPLPYLFIVYLHSYIFLEQFFKEVILRRKNLVWFKPDRIIAHRI
jgi:cellulose synthase/poly-beta-1,6-N-acetylglucosamine synthase-like glycosyltransferase